ncbi:MAG: DUF3226 domain-containing protein [Planctomycetota bacterium]
MSNFTYIVAEGVLDVVVLTQVLKHGFAFAVVERKSDLPGLAARWLTQFKWPVGNDIARRSVPAPAFLLKDGWVIGLRNAQGLDNIKKTVRADTEAFLRLPWMPAAMGIVLDADDTPPANRFPDFAALLQTHGYPRPAALDTIARSGELRAGVFAFPGKGRPGTLEDILVPLGATRFPILSRHAERYVADWRSTDDAQTDADFKELRSPSGPKKARLSAAVALLKPAKALPASIEDQGWVPADPRCCDALKPLMGFLDQLLAPAATGKSP